MRRRNCKIEEWLSRILKDHLLRRSGHTVQDRPSWSVRWADIPELSVSARRCPMAWQQYWQQSRRTPRWSSTFRFSGCLMVGSQLRFPWSVRVCLVPGSCSVFSVLAPFWHAEGTTRALVVLVPLNARGLHLARARGGHAARARRPGARRSLPRCVNQCSLSGPRLRTGEPLTSPLP